MATKQFKAESKRLLDLMIHSIYTHKEIFLRELISNASDACDKRYFKSLTDTSIGITKDDLHIHIQPDKENRTLTVRDNGIGMTKEELENKIATFTGGRAAEELIFHQITTGASNDIEQATKLAKAMITRYGMNEEFGMVAMETMTNQYLGGDSSMTCSLETQTEIDKKVRDLVKLQHSKAYKILEDNVGKLHELAQYLYEHETITGEEFMEILNKPVEIPVKEADEA